MLTFSQVISPQSARGATQSLKYPTKSIFLLVHLAVGKLRTVINNGRQ